VGAVLALVDPAQRGNVLGVHDFRVAARSLRAALRTLTRRADAPLVEQTKSSLRVAIRTLADVRDRDVGRSLIAKLKSGPAIDPGLKRRILGLSDSDRRVALIHSETRWPKKLDRQLITLLRRGEASVERVIRRTRAEAWQQRRRAIDVLNILGRRYSPVRLHELRRRVRAIRYALEVLAEVDSGANSRVIVLKPLQSALGDAQDNIVLSRWLASQAARFRRRDPVLSNALGQQSVHFRSRSAGAHASFLTLKPKAILEGLALHVDPHSESPPPASGRRQRRPPSTPRTRTRRSGRPEGPPARRRNARS
jgi:CHAD domain-containing protein